jgi:formiminoglutamase
MHSDFRILEDDIAATVFRMLWRRVLKKYFILVLHENYTSSVLDIIKKNRRSCTIQYLRQRKHSKRKNFNQEMALAFINDDFFGIEIDLDSIQILPVVQWLWAVFQ